MDSKFLWESLSVDQMRSMAQSSQWITGSGELVQTIVEMFIKELSEQKTWTLDGMMVAWISTVEAFTDPRSILRPFILMGFINVAGMLGVPEKEAKRAEEALDFFIRTILLKS